MTETHDFLNLYRQTGLIVIIFDMFFLGVRLFEGVRLFGRSEYVALHDALRKATQTVKPKNPLL